MAIVPVFHGSVTEDGTLVLFEAERARRRAHLQSLAGKIVEVVIRKERLRRSNDQNAYIHAVPVFLLAEYFGYSLDEMKWVLMGECWGWRMDKVSGREIPLKPHTSDMTVEECSHFIDWVIPWAMVNHGVAIPLPNEVAA